MNRDQKTVVIDRLKTSLADVPAVVVADFKGLTVEQTNDLRSRFRQADVRYEVVKNTLFKRAVSGTPKESLEPLFRGNSAIAFHEEDPVVAAKILRDYLKENSTASIALKGGWLAGDLLDEAGVTALAELPGKDELRATLLNVFMAAPTQLVRTFAAGPQTFAQLLSARREQLESA